MKYNLQKTIVQYIKHSDGTEVFFRGKFSPEINIPLSDDLQLLLDNGEIEIIEREEEAFVEEVIGHVVQRKHYQLVRRYPDMKEQLDMLWHELNTTGGITTDGNWFNTIQSIKEQHPKP